MKYLFLHIPKSGGSYIDKIKKEGLLSDNIITPDEYSNQKRWHMSFIPGSHIYANPKTDFALSQEEFSCIQDTRYWKENPFIFTVLRDPWSTLWSLFCHDNFKGFDLVNDRVKLYSFHKFVDWFLNDEKEWGIDSINTPYKKNIYYQCFDKDNQVMPDVSLNFDTLNDSLTTFLKDTGNLNGNLPQEKVRQGSPFIKDDVYDSKTFNAVGDKYFTRFNDVKSQSLFI